MDNSVYEFKLIKRLNTKIAAKWNHHLKTATPMSKKI
jgi:hypothetical protein